MAKKRSRLQNPEPFLPEENASVASSKKRSKAPRNHQQQEKTIASGISSKILKEALIQQREIEEEAQERNPTREAFADIAKHSGGEVEDEDGDIDDFAGFSETQSRYDDFEGEIDEEDERILEAFLSKGPSKEPTLTDIIVKKIKENDAQVSSESRPLPKMDSSVIDLYKGVGEFMSKYTAGKVPKAFRKITAMQHWEDVLYLTEPEKWSPNGMYQATRILASNLGSKKAERFYRLVLLPRVRDDIKKNKRLHFALYQALKKAIFKPAAFNKGILFPLCKGKINCGHCNQITHKQHNRAKPVIDQELEPLANLRNLWFSYILLEIERQIMFFNLTHQEFLVRLVTSGTCNLREAVIVGSVIQKVTIPMLHSSVALLKLAEMEYCGTTSYFIKLLLEKKYALPYRVIDALVAHYMRFMEDSRIMPVIWHQSLLAFVQRYKNELQKEDKVNLRTLVGRQRHYLVTPEIVRELDNSRNRGEKEDDLMAITSVSVINKTIEEDRFDIPEVPMEED